MLWFCKVFDGNAHRRPASRRRGAGTSRRSWSPTPAAARRDQKRDLEATKEGFCPRLVRKQSETAVKVDFLMFRAAENVNRESLSAAAFATQLLSRALMAL